MGGSIPTRKYRVNRSPQARQLLLWRCCWEWAAPGLGKHPLHDIQRAMMILGTGAVFGLPPFISLPRQSGRARQA
jgi:hypothetical protein